jgi:DNA-binding MarR family transcriptional regulator/GNAT superfamily N-acetyltransferase
MNVDPDQVVSAIRRFSRFYTHRVGVLHEGLLDSRFSLAEARVLYELAHRDFPSASDIGGALSLDPGYLSRILQRFERDGLVVRAASGTDRRLQTIALTEAGANAFAGLDATSRREMAKLVEHLPISAQSDLMQAMNRVEQLLDPGAERSEVSLRAPLPGDIGWVVERHAAVYAAEYGFDHRFEALVAQVAGQYLATRNPDCEFCWIAQRGQERLGSIFLVQGSPAVGKIRLLLVEPSARGLGIGRILVQTCIETARTVGYSQLTLWTNDVLVAARNIYAAAGFRMIDSTPHADFGPPMRGENWTLDLD